MREIFLVFVPLDYVAECRHGIYNPLVNNGEVLFELCFLPEQFCSAE